MAWASAMREVVAAVGLRVFPGAVTPGDAAQLAATCRSGERGIQS